MAHNLKILNVNASRISRRDRIVGLMALVKSIGPNIICIQEINIREAYAVFRDNFQVIINGDECMGEGIGIVLSLIHIPSPRDKRQSRMPSSA